jgi:cyclomaltodextrin glucanotransferase
VVDVTDGGTLSATVPAHGVEVYLLDAAVTRADLKEQLDKAMAAARRRE